MTDEEKYAMKIGAMLIIMELGTREPTDEEISEADAYLNLVLQAQQYYLGLQSYQSSISTNH